MTGFLLSGIYYLTAERTIEKTLKTKANTIVRDHIVWDGTMLLYKKGDEGETLTSRLRDYDISVVIFDHKLERIGTYGYYKNLVDEGKLSLLVSGEKLTKVLNSQKPDYTDVLIAERLFDVYTMPLLFDNRAVGVLQVSVQNTLLETFLSVGGTVFLLVIPVSILISWVSVFVTTRYSLRPLAELVRYMEKVSFTYLPATMKPDTVKLLELQTVSAAFNSMIGRLRDAITKQRSYADHLSHELKTPLSRAVTTLDLIDQQLGEHETEKSVTDIRAARKELLTMGSTIDSILHITQQDTDHTYRVASDIISVPHELETIQSQYRQNISERQLNMAIACPDNLSLVIPRDHFRMIIGNLLSNAIKYANRGGTVRIRFHPFQKHAECFIENSGSAMTANDIPDMLMRYVRGNIHRFLTRGTGLGLPLVKDLCDLHSLKLSIHSEDNSHTRVTIGGFIVASGKTT